MSDYETYRALTARAVESVLNEMVRRQMIAQLNNVQMKEFADSLAALVPLGMGSYFVTAITANLWLAARAVKMSDRLPRPWPFICLLYTSRCV